MENEKSCFWARFEEINGELHRFDTRIYLNQIEKISDSDECIGAIIAKNPGSAKNGKNSLGVLAPLKLDNDKLLPTIKNWISEADHNKKAGQYVQVLNTFYLCNPNLREAFDSIMNKEKIDKLKEKQKADRTNTKNGDKLKIEDFIAIDPAEKKSFPWVWIMWGGLSGLLADHQRCMNFLKSRFEHISNNVFYVLQNKDPKKTKIVEEIPANNICAKHSQGMQKGPAMEYLKNNIFKK